MSEPQIFGAYALDNARCTVWTGEASVALTRFEATILSRLMSAQGQIVSKYELTAALYPDRTPPLSNGIEVFVGRLRKKLGPDSIRVKRSRGYVLHRDAQP